MEVLINGLTGQRIDILGWRRRRAFTSAIYTVARTTLSRSQARANSPPSYLTARGVSTTLAPHVIWPNKVPIGPRTSTFGDDRDLIPAIRFAGISRDQASVQDRSKTDHAYPKTQKPDDTI
jgi:hypothetical protein